MPELHVVISSVREGRIGLSVANWFMDAVARHGKFQAKKIDLKEVALPLLSEPNHPRQKKYEQETTKRWSASVDAADAFVFVTPEYNYGSPPALVNALDHVFHEWAYKPVSFVSYGGVSGGLRSVQMTKGIVTTMKMMPLDGVSIPMIFKHVKDGVFTPEEGHEKSAAAALDELLRWTAALQGLRRPAG